MFEEITEKLRARLDELSKGKWKTSVRMVDTELICPNPFHAPQKIEESEIEELTQKFKKEGIRTPITVAAIGDAKHPLFQIVSGEKQYRACLYGKISPIPCVILDTDTQRINNTGDLSFSRNYFDEAELFRNALNETNISEENLAKNFGITVDLLQNRLKLLKFDTAERKLILQAHLSEESAIALEALPPRAKLEVYRAIESGISTQTAEATIAELSQKRQKTHSCIKDTRFFFNSIDKAVKTMNESGIAVKCSREEKKSFTKLTIIVPKRTSEP